MVKTTNYKGDVGLVNVIADLVENGLYIFTPLSDTTIIDIIVANERMETKKIQVKYKSIEKDGCLDLSCSSVINGKRKKIDNKLVDIWAIYCINNKMIYYIPTEILNNKSCISIRINEPKQHHKTMTYGKNFTSIENAWNYGE